MGQPLIARRIALLSNRAAPEKRDKPGATHSVLGQERRGSLLDCKRPFHGGLGSRRGAPICASVRRHRARWRGNQAGRVESSKPGSSWSKTKASAGAGAGVCVACPAQPPQNYGEYAVTPYAAVVGSVKSERERSGTAVSAAGCASREPLLDVLSPELIVFRWRLPKRIRFRRRRGLRVLRAAGCR